MNNYEVFIGLEIHAVLDTKTKAFCSCKNEFGAMANTLVCPVCLGLPGAMPVLNKEAFKLAIRAGLSFGSDINDYAIFERKNYFYPDLSKAYQISQLEKPICLNGGIKLDSNKFIRFNRIHLEEDAAKLIHVSDDVGTFIDYNRCGIPLIEMVTEPDFSSKEEVVEFLEKLRKTLIFANISTCKMEEGELKCDVNISIKKFDDKNLGTRVEMKNLNSFKSISKAIDYEVNRQIEILNNGGVVEQETRGWDDDKEINFSSREKENETDYRYFPDPDVLTVRIDKKDIENIKNSMPETLDCKVKRYLSFGLSEYDVSILTSEKYISDYFEKVLELTKEPKETAHWIMTDVLRVEKESVQAKLEDIISSESLADIIKLVLSNKITRTSAKVLFDNVIVTGKDVKNLIYELGLLGFVNDNDIEKIVNDLILERPNIKEDFLKDSNSLMNFILGHIMKVTNGRTDIDKAKNIIFEMLSR